MHHFKRAIPFSIIILVILTYNACTKLDTTNIGADLIPEVDNVNTFADTLDITTTQGVFSTDSTKLSLTEEYVVGKVNDPLMGSTDASIYLQFKPPYYPYSYKRVSTDTLIQADSLVLCLSYKSFWGDSTQPIQLRVYEVSEDAHGQWDSVFSYNTINYQPILNGPLSDPKTIDIRSMTNYVKVGKRDSINNQIRIKLYDYYRDSLFTRDTTRNKAFTADSLFRFFNNGFAVLASSGNSLIYVNLLEDQTRLEMHYRKRNAGVIDTVYSNFYFNSGLKGETIRRSSVANKITRNRSTLPTGDQEIYLQTTPGTYANLTIPGLDNITNRVIHRAELQIQQIPDPVYDKIYVESPYLYVDLVDSGTNKWKPVYYDLNPSAPYDPDFKIAGVPYFPYNAEVDLGYFGGFLKKRYDQTGAAQAYYNINLTRYIQQLVTRRTPNYKLRLFPAHSMVYPQYSPTLIPYKNPIAYGRVRIGGGQHPNPAYRMRLRIVYSKIK